MKQYHKIQTLFKRDMENKGKIILGEYSRQEFKFLENCKWGVTEKIDGTNVRVMVRDGVLSFGGKTDNAQMHAGLVNYLRETFMAEKITSAIPDCPEICLYGEGYGAGIQKGGKYREDAGFILFDVKIGESWLDQENVLDIASKLQIDVVPDLSEGTLNEIVAMVRNGTTSRFGNFLVEGVVAKPSTTLFNKCGDRIITKLKTKDFE